MYGGSMMRMMTPAVTGDPPQLEVEDEATRLRTRVGRPLTDLNFIWNVLAVGKIASPWC